MKVIGSNYCRGSNKLNQRQQSFPCLNEPGKGREVTNEVKLNLVEAATEMKQFKFNKRRFRQYIVRAWVLVHVEPHKRKKDIY